MRGNLLQPRERGTAEVLVAPLEGAHAGDLRLLFLLSGADQFGELATIVRKASHNALAKVEDDIVRLRFNRCIAHANELVNKLGHAIGSIETAEIGPDLAFACREGAEALVLLISPMMPHLAESCWADLGHGDLVSLAPWRVADRTLIREDVITLPIQVNGKKRAEVILPRDSDEATIRTIVLANDDVQKAIDGRMVKRVVVVRERIVNVVI